MDRKIDVNSRKQLVIDVTVIFFNLIFVDEMIYFQKNANVVDEGFFGGLEAQQK